MLIAWFFVDVFLNDSNNSSIWTVSSKMSESLALETPPARFERMRRAMVFIILFGFGRTYLQGLWSNSSLF